VIYPESARRIIRDTPPEQGDTLVAGSEGIYGFQNAQYCHDDATLHRSNNRTLTAATSDLSGAGTSNHLRGIPQAGEIHLPGASYLWLSKRLIIAPMQGCIVAAVIGRFESHKYPHFRQKVYTFARGVNP